jgi:hypothetical protein
VKIVVYNDIVSTHDVPQSLYFPAKGSIHINASPVFKCCVKGMPLKSLPYTFTDLFPGTYNVQVILEDTDTMRKWFFYDEKIILSPFENINRDLKSFNYRYKWGLTFIPSAAQFYNREPIKGGIVLGVFLGSMAFTGISLYFYDYYLQRYNNLRQKGYESSYEDNQKLAKDLNDASDMMDLFSYLLIGGIVSTSIVFLYSAIDGYITMDHLYHLIYQ